jgi:hypothetical protein
MRKTHVGVKLDNEELVRLERVRAILAEQNPYYQPTVSDALRFCLGVASGSVAAPITTGGARDGPA